MIEDKKLNNLIHELMAFPKKRISLFKEIPVKNQGFILLKFSEKLQKEIINKLNDKELLECIEFLDPDKITDLLQNLSIHRREKILMQLGKEIQEKTEYLLKFDPRTAAGIMSLDYIEVNKNMSFKEISEKIQMHEKRTGKFPVILVVENGDLIGELPPHALVLSKLNEKIINKIKKISTIKFNASEKEVIHLFERTQHSKVIVLDEKNCILGVIYSDDILKLMQKQKDSSLRDFAGVSKEEDVFDSALIKVKNRYKWLIINLGTAFLAASVVSLFQETISAFVLLAVYMPIVAGMGGNAGTQTLAVTVRGLALKKMNFKTAKIVILNEVIAGGINGLITGILVALIAFILNQNPLFGLVIGTALIINLIIAGFFGATIPMIMKKLGKDPASSATIFITTATDIFGFFVFLGLATILL
jgi:magnesium transporter